MDCREQRVKIDRRVRERVIARPATDLDRHDSHVSRPSARSAALVEQIGLNRHRVDRLLFVAVRQIAALKLTVSLSSLSGRKDTLGWPHRLRVQHVRRRR